MAPHLFACVPKRKANKRIVQEALMNYKWLEDIQRHYSIEVLSEYLDIWDLVQEVDLQPDSEDVHKWCFEPSSQFSTINHLLSACVFARQLWHRLLNWLGLQDVTPTPENGNFYLWWQDGRE